PAERCEADQQPAARGERTPRALGLSALGITRRFRQTQRREVLDDVERNENERRKKRNDAPPAQKQIHERVAPEIPVDAKPAESPADRPRKANDEHSDVLAQRGL